MQLNLSKSYENRIKFEKMHEKWTACPIWTIEIPIGIAFFRSEFPITDRKSGNPIGNLDSEIQFADPNSGNPIENLEFRSEIWISDPISNFPIFDFFFQKLINEKNKKENAFEAKKYPV